MRKIRVFCIVLVVLGLGFVTARLPLTELSGEAIDKYIDAKELLEGKVKIVNADEGLFVIERSKGGTAPSGKVFEKEKPMYGTKIVKFRDGRTTCYMLFDFEDASSISCVRTTFP